MKNKERILKSLKKTTRRNSDFRHLTCNSGKGQKNGLRRLKIEEGDVIVTVCNKDEIERIIIKHTKEHFSKAKDTKAHNDEMHDVMKKMVGETML